MDNDSLYSPDVVDFIIRKASSYESLILNHPGLLACHDIGMYYICYAKIPDYTEMISYMGTDYINSVPKVMGLLDRQSLEAAGIIQVQQQPYLNLNGKNVLIGFVDTGIDYTQKVFQYDDGTSKIQYIYDQTAPGTPPEGFPLGTEYNNEQINAALASDTPYDIVPQQDTAGHGTFLASVSAGRPMDDFIGAAPDSEIIMVKLKKAYPFYLNRFFVPAEQENAFESSSAMIGVQYILQKAKELDRPVVICIGLGSNYDSHDGFGFIEEYLFNMSNVPGVCICIAVGNESQARHHYFQRFSKEGTPESIDIKVGENAGDIFILVTNPISDRVSVSVRSPTGELVSRVPAKAGNTFTTQLVLERSEVSVSYFFPLEGSGDQVTIVKIKNATPGIWTITAYGDIIQDGSINAWLPITGFISPAVEFLSSDPYNTVTSPANALGGIHCGAYNSIRNSLYPESSWGAVRSLLDIPDLVAPGYQVGGFYPTGYGTMNGTSVATAITSGACALMLQWGIVEGNNMGLSTPLIRAYLIRGCSRTEVMEYPNPQWGYGTLNLIQTFFYMREL
ncbi:S8 family peptidase [Aminipila terrae]|uniref:S8 family serine peptidase n=1 Tax=Aminipila terrae TaxID=2697030 RepID=A0A6P1MCV4_9FIRM|nr:S8 family peptidase [Aminipila terrae]QHI71852.1 S8 family serine peptidase [Aminipila terrae]